MKHLFTLSPLFVPHRLRHVRSSRQWIASSDVVPYPWDEGHPIMFHLWVLSVIVSENTRILDSCSGIEFCRWNVVEVEVTSFLVSDCALFMAHRRKAVVLCGRSIVLHHDLHS